MSTPLDQHRNLRELPSVQELASMLAASPHAVAVRAARDAIDAARQRVVAGGDLESELRALHADAQARATELTRPSLRRVINATGIVLHTNLGRAPLAQPAAARVAEVARGYSNLEYDLERGERGSRMSHLEELLVATTGAEGALAVNNNAAAVLLALAATASGREVVVSRGELVEIGGSFRIPEIMAASGARLVEVGTTNRTRIEDYERAIGPRTAALLRVHQSNFRTVGFVEQPALSELAALAKVRSLPLIDDLGSGALAAIADEPVVSASVAAGADLVCFSADKLLGGPQAGIVCGAGAYVEACARHPLARALRLDKLQLAALEATLRLHRDGRADAIPAIAMLDAEPAALARRAARLAEAIGPAAEVARSAAPPGGGTMPLTELSGPVCVVTSDELGPEGLAARLRRHDPPVIARIEAAQLVLDPRTLDDDAAEAAATAVRVALG